MLTPRNDTDRSRALDLEPMGVIDIGSNSVRLVVYEGAIRSPTPIFNEKVLAGLGRTVASTGRLGDEAVERAITSLKRFRAINRILGVKNVRAIATAACREAQNGPEFIRRARDAAGVDISILTGAQEADLAAQGIQMGFHQPDGIAGDLGGGSLELVDISGTKLQGATTLPLGGLRLLDISGDRIDKAADIADAEYAKVPWIAGARGRTFYAVGGTWRSLAKLHMARRDYPLRVMHGYTIATAEAIDFCESIRKGKKLNSADAGNIPKARREVIPYGAMVLERLLKRLQPKDVVFSVFGIREGLVYKLLSPTERRKDPLLAFADDFARLRSRSLRHAHELSNWTDALFQSPGPNETDYERRLRHAACVMSDIGWRAHPDYRGEQCLNLVAHAALAGIDHPGRVALALAIYYRHDGAGDGDADGGRELSTRLERLAPSRMLKRARIIGAAIRMAHMISIGRPNLIDEVGLGYEKNKLLLTLPRHLADLDGERLRRRLDDLAKLVDKSSDIRIG